MSASISSFLQAGGSLAENAVGPLLGGIISGHGPNRTIPALTPYSLYALALRSSGFGGIPLFIYTFPLSPANISREVVGMGNFFDVSGPASNFGVNRIIDQYGQSPPIYTLKGTTGVKFHSRDGFIWSGLQSIQILKGMISQYFSLNAAAVQAGDQNLYKLEFYDYYMGEFWEVVPIGPQGTFQSSQAPQLVFYQFHFVGRVSLEQPIANILDPILSKLETPLNKAFTELGSKINSFLTSYSQSSPISSLGENF